MTENSENTSDEPKIEKEESEKKYFNYDMKEKTASEDSNSECDEIDLKYKKIDHWYKKWNFILAITAIFATILFIVANFINTNYQNYWSDFRERRNVAIEILESAARYAASIDDAADQAVGGGDAMYSEFIGKIQKGKVLFSGTRFGNCLNELENIIIDAEDGILVSFPVEGRPLKAPSRQIVDAVQVSQEVLNLSLVKPSFYTIIIQNWNILPESTSISLRCAD